MTVAAVPSFKDELNSGAALTDNRLSDIARKSLLGLMLAGVRGKVVTQSSSAAADMIDLDTIDTTARIAPCTPGANVNVRAGGTSAVSQLWRNIGIMSIEVPAAGLTIDGAANGGVTITPKTGVSLRYAQYVPGVNAAAILPRRITCIDENSESLPFDDNPVKEVILRIKTTDGSTVDATETATDIVAALNADATFSQWAVAAVKTGDTGAGLVAAQVATARGALPVVTGAGFATSYYGRRLIFPTTVTDAVLNWGAGGPSCDLAMIGRNSPQPR